jgi:PKD domain-containing protein
MKLIATLAALLFAAFPAAASARRHGHRAAQPAAVTFSSSPSAPVTGSPVDFSASASDCDSAPCTYAWSDDGGASRPSSELWPLGTGASLSFTFHEAGTKYVRLVVTDALGRAATVEHDVLVRTSAMTAPPQEELPAEQAEPPPAEPELPEEETQAEEGSAGEETGEEEPVSDETGSTPAEAPSGEKNCLNDPHVCGYPDATNSGVPSGTALTSHAGETVTTPGAVVKDESFTGELTVDASNVTVEDDQINQGVNVAPGLTGVTVEHSTCAGSNIQNCVFAKSKALVKDDYFTGCGECINGAVTLEDSYLDVSAVIPEEHYEAVYYGGGEGALVIDHNTMFSPNHDQGETAVIFASVDFGNQTTLTIDDNLLAGGNFTIYGGGSGSGGQILGPVTVRGNRFSRKYDANGGYYGVASYFNDAVTTWSGNVWDETLAPVEGP